MTKTVDMPYMFSININGKWKVMFRDAETRDKFMKHMRMKNSPALSAMINSGEAMRVPIDEESK